MNQDFASAPGMLKETGGPGILRDLPKAPKIDFASTGFDFRKEVERMASEAKQSDAANLRVALNLPPDLGLAFKTDVLDVDAILLQQAREHVSKREFAAAKEKLEPFVAKQPRHPEARYLLAVCILNVDNAVDSLDEEIEALETLEPLRNMRLGRELTDRVDLLKSAIRTKVLRELPIHFLARDHRALFDDVQRLLALDPDGAVYYAFKAIILAEHGDLNGAYQAVETGASVAGDRVPPILLGLRTSLLAQLLRAAFAPAIEHYKRGEYDKARKALGRVDQRFESTREYQLFGAHLKRLGGTGFFGFGVSKKMPWEVTVDEPPEDRDRLYAVIVGAELDQANAYLQAGEFPQARALLEKALACAPEYPIVNYLFAGCRFKMLHDLLTTGGGTDVDTALAELGTCALYAEAAVNDSRIAARGAAAAADPGHDGVLRAGEVGAAAPAGRNEEGERRDHGVHVDHEPGQGRLDPGDVRVRLSPHDRAQTAAASVEGRGVEQGQPRSGGPARGRRRQEPAGPAEDEHGRSKGRSKRPPSSRKQAAD